MGEGKSQLEKVGSFGGAEGLSTGVGCRPNTPQWGWCGRWPASALHPYIHLPPGVKALALTVLTSCQAQHLSFSPTLRGSPLAPIRVSTGA